MYGDSSSAVMRSKNVNKEVRTVPLGLHRVQDTTKLCGICHSETNGNSSNAYTPSFVDLYSRVDLSQVSSLVTEALYTLTKIRT